MARDVSTGNPATSGTADAVIGAEKSSQQRQELRNSGGIFGHTAIQEIHRLRMSS